MLQLTSPTRDAACVSVSCTGLTTETPAKRIVPNNAAIPMIEKPTTPNSNDDRAWCTSLLNNVETAQTHDKTSAKSLSAVDHSPGKKLF